MIWVVGAVLPDFYAQRWEKSKEKNELFCKASLAM